MNAFLRAVRIPLARRLMIRLAVAGFAVAAAVAAIELSIEYGAEIDALTTHMEQVESGYLASVIENTWLEDRERLDILVTGVQRLPDIELVQVLDSRGSPVAAAGAMPDGATMVRSFDLVRDYHGKKVDLGELRVVASLDALRRRIAGRAWLVAGGALALVLTLSSLLYMMVHQLVTSRLVPLAEYVRRVGREGPVDAAPVVLDGGIHDEFTDLQTTFNDMRAALSASYQTIREREARYRDLFTNSPVPLWEEDFSEVAVVLRAMAADGVDLGRLLDERPDVVRSLAARVRVIDVNAAAMALHNASDREELLGRLAAIFTPTSFLAFKRQLLAIWMQEWELVLESEVRTLDGDIREVVVRWLVPAGSRESLARVIVSTEDVTERKVAERSLGMTLEKLTQANSELERFAFIASHDLQEPVRSIVSFSQLLERRCAVHGTADGESAEFLEFLKAAALRMQRQVDGLADFSRAGQSVRAFEPVDLGDALEEAKRRLADQLLETGGRVIARQLPVVFGDRQQLTDLFRQLLDNSIKFRRPGLPPEIVVSSERIDSEWRVSLRDNGIGIDPSYASDIFQVFRRLHGPSQYPGAGIGLATCRRIAERHGGRIWAESTSGPGAVIYVTLPLSDDPIDLHQGSSPAFVQP